MKYLYVDNFRGFQKTFIPIFDVNFLVGENSTGKTSILSLLKLLSSRDFQFRLQFNTDEINFGYFKDIVSAGTIDKSYFDIGLVAEVPATKDREGRINASLYTFKEEKGTGMPTIKRYSCQPGKFELSFAFSKSYIKVKHNQVSKVTDCDEFISDRFSSWIQDHRNDDKGFKKLNKEQLQGAVPLAVLTSMVYDKLEGEKEIDNDRLVYHFQDYPIFDEEIAWLAPIRSKPKRTYDSYTSDYSPEGEHVPYLIEKIFDGSSNAGLLRNFLESIGKESGLFDGISVKKYGKSATSPFRLDVIISNNLLNVCNVGYGVSQALPVLVELYLRRKGTWFAIQQPEVHLHPKAQAALGSLFFKMASFDKKHFFIETHSEYTIDRYRMEYRKIEDNQAPESQILYFEKSENGNLVHNIVIKDNGDLPEEQPEGYRDFFIKEQMDALGL